MSETVVAVRSLNRDRRRWIVAGWAVFVLAAMGAIFYLPTLVPVAPAVSDSYFFGYSNRTGVLLLFGFLVAGGFFSKSLGVEFCPARRMGVISRRALWVWTAVFAAAGAAMYLVAHGLQGLVESVYLIDRVKMLAAGGRPYRDFEFAYGALLLYGPRVLMALRLSAEQSYFVFWLLSLLSSPWLVAQVLEMLDYPSEHQGEIFNLFCMLGLIAVLCTGLNYTIWRFLSAVYFGLLVQRVDGRGGQRDRLLAMLMSVMFTAVLLTISPEMALAYGAGTLGYFGVFGRWDWRSASAYCGLLVADASVVVAANKLQVFETLKSFSAGAFNFPIVPGAHILLFFFACGLVSLFVAARLREGSRGDGMLMVVAVSMGALPAALGRCDLGHVAFAGIGILIVATVLVSTFPLLWRSYRGAFIVVVILYPAFLGLVTAPATVARRVAIRQNAARSDVCKAIFETKEKMFAPFGYGPAAFCEPRSEQISTGYFFGETNMFSPAMVDLKMSELMEHPERRLLLPNDFGQCKVDMAEERRFIQVLFAYPYSAEVRHEVNIVEPLCDYINENYQKTVDFAGHDSGYSVWARVNYPVQ